MVKMQECKESQELESKPFSFRNMRQCRENFEQNLIYYELSRCLVCDQRDNYTGSKYRRIFQKCYKCGTYACSNCPDQIFLPLCWDKCRFGHMVSMAEAGRCWSPHHYCKECIVSEQALHNEKCLDTHNGKTKKVHCKSRCKIWTTAIKK